MEESLKFNSQICTTIEQSQRLLDLGLKPETADMCWFNDMQKPACTPYKYFVDRAQDMKWVFYPAWSLHRLLDILPNEIIHEDCYLKLCVSRNIVYYADNEYAETFNIFDGGLYNCIIRCIEWLIKSGYFNKEYLKQ